MIIDWRDNMVVDNGMVDEDHRHLIRIINSFATEAAKGANDKALAQILLDLKDYAVAHFSREEALQLQISYPFAQAHKKAHADLIKMLNEIMKNFVENRFAGDLQASVVEIGGLLRHWLVDHIIENDLRMRPYAKEMQRYRGHYTSLDREVMRSTMAR